ncbi:hypothetical protein IT570_03385 [Candidatus Sumerlaeota bacterium]|nr:hypothetical protein [Candidatus Sumerlaeota bacterium]
MAHGMPTKRDERAEVEAIIADLKIIQEEYAKAPRQNFAREIRGVMTDYRFNPNEQGNRGWKMYDARICKWTSRKQVIENAALWIWKRWREDRS